MTESNPQQDQRLNALLRGPLWEGLSPDERASITAQPPKCGITTVDLLKAIRTLARHLADIPESRIEEERSTIMGFANMIAEIRDRIDATDSAHETSA